MLRALHLIHLLEKHPLRTIRYILIEGLALLIKDEDRTSQIHLQQQMCVHQTVVLEEDMGFERVLHHQDGLSLA